MIGTFLYALNNTITKTHSDIKCYNYKVEQSIEGDFDKSLRIKPSK